MILVDSSVWIDYFRGNATAQTEILDELLGSEPLAIGDLILTEVLQGCRGEPQFQELRQRLGALELIVLGGEEVAIETARNFRRLRERGITVRKTIDTIIASRCILDGHALLHDDRDFDPFEQHLGLRVIASVD
ncbi:MAG: PIN domain nuclease [Hydrogenophilales bacterium]|nr:PIN domain nuclease [Hydrogenophilales bacterium]